MILKVKNIFCSLIKSFVIQLAKTISTNKNILSMSHAELS